MKCKEWLDLINEKEFDEEFDVFLTKEDLMMYYGVYSEEDLDRID